MRRMFAVIKYRLGHAAKLIASAPHNNGMHPTRISIALKLNLLGGRVMPGVGRLTMCHHVDEGTEMPRLMRYDAAATIPPRLEAQIRSLLHVEWPGPDEGHTAQPLCDPELHPAYFVLANGDQVLSYARTIWATVLHRGQSFKLYGLGDVVTRLEFRLKGYGGCVAKEATTHIRSDQEADAAVLLTEPKLEAFYRRSGWEYVPGLRVVTSEYDECAAGEAFPMMLFLSAKAHAAREILAEDSLILPGDEW